MTKPMHYRQSNGWTPCILQPSMRARRTTDPRKVTCPRCAEAAPTCQSCGLPARPSTLHDTGFACPDGCGAVSE